MSDCNHAKLKDIQIIYNKSRGRIELKCPNCKQVLVFANGEAADLAKLLADFYFTLREKK